jgi:hypothetical protein
METDAEVALIPDDFQPSPTHENELGGLGPS